MVKWPDLPRHDMAPRWETEIIGYEPDPSTVSEEMLDELTAILHEQAEAIKKGSK